jgi:hypothetical protein
LHAQAPNQPASLGQRSRGHKIRTGKRAGLVLRSQGGVWKGSTVAHIEGPRPERWRSNLWLVMTGAGVLLLIFAALSV